MAARSSGMPATGVYVVWLAWIARMPACLMGSGVGKSGSPAVKSSTGLQALASALAFAAKARVGEPSMYLRRSASTACEGNVMVRLPLVAHHDPERAKRVEGSSRFLAGPEPAQPSKQSLRFLGILLGPLWHRPRSRRCRLRRFGRRRGFESLRDCWLDRRESAECQQRALGPVAASEAQTQHAGVPAGHIDEPRRDVGEEPLDQRAILEHAEGSAAGRDAAFLP